jgi:hypothetical protein
MKIGDKVTIIKSPYFNIKTGTVATIIDIKFAQYGESWIVYILDLPCQAFKAYEIKKIE